MFSENTLAEIKSRCDIVDVIGRYVDLKKSGQGYQGLCPFHNEKTPSFHVHPLKQVYRCFGSCQKGGNVFTFLMEHEGLNFPEAVRKLADQVGVRIEEEKTFTKVPRKVSQEEEKAQSALEWAAKYFHHLLTKKPEYQFALKYLEKRGLSSKSIERFRLGVAPSGWNTLIQAMTKRGFSWEDLLAAGLVVPKEDSKFKGYDRFRERLMFPITDKSGKVVGFGARALKEGDEPKYLNSPETAFFNKSRILYGLFENQRDIRLNAEALVVEGYMDVVGLFEAGVTNAIAPMGTALTLEHCREIKALSQKVVTVFDPDAAGLSAWHRSVSLFLEAGLFAKDVSLKEGLDPDEFVKKFGATTFYQLCDEAPQQTTKYLKEIAEKGVLGEKDRNKYLQELIPVLVSSRRLPDKGALLWDDVSRLLNISFDALKKLVQDSNSRTIAPALQGGPSYPRPKTTNSPQAPDKNPLDWEFLRLSLKYPDRFLVFPKEDWLSFLKEPSVQSVLEKLSHAKDTVSFQNILEALSASIEDPRVLSYLTGSLLTGSLLGATSSTGTEEPDEKELFDEVAKRLSERRQKAEIKGLANQVRLSQRLGDSEEQIKLLEQLMKLKAPQPELDSK